MHRHSVIFVREMEQQLTGSGCCGRLEGDFLGCAGERVFPERRAGMEAMGPLYRALHARYGDTIDLEVIDPRNAIALGLLLLRDFRRFRVGFGEAWRTLTRLPVQALVLDGRLVARGAWPAADEVIGVLEGSTPARPRVGAPV
ncbi:MAG: hypothetical protein FJ207_13010 [Gemmatimonadetes bacterium]|nr:hypothetical protein [Gemmatimonadota bacterium]